MNIGFFAKKAKNAKLQNLKICCSKWSENAPKLQKLHGKFLFCNFFLNISICGEFPDHLEQHIWSHLKAYNLSFQMRPHMMF